MESVLNSMTTVEAPETHSQRLESIGMLASGVAHELNNPLGVVMSLAHLIKDDARTAGNIQGFAAIIIAESARMAEMVRSLLHLSGHDNEPPRNIDVRDLVERTISLMHPTFRKDGIMMTADISNGLPLVRCQSQQIQQVLMNLLTNARDTTNEAFPGVSPEKVIRVMARAFDRGGHPWVRITVEDKGAGISPEISQALFEPFFTTKPKDRGTGLGLSISKNIIEDHGGRLHFESRANAGTEFHIDLRAS